MTKIGAKLLKCGHCRKEIQLSHGFSDSKTGLPLCDGCVIKILSRMEQGKPWPRRKARG